MSKRTPYRINKDGWWVLRTILKNDEDFNPDSASLRGRKSDGYEWFGFGRLSEENKELFRLPGLEYVVYSYHTPIAWRTHGEWVTPDVKYSMATSKHQGKVFTAIRQLNEEKNNA